MALWLPNTGDTLNSRPFPPRAVVFRYEVVRGPLR